MCIGRVLNFRHDKIGGIGYTGLRSISISSILRRSGSIFLKVEEGVFSLITRASV